MRASDLNPGPKAADRTSGIPCVAGPVDVPPHMRRYAAEHDAWHAKNAAGRGRRT